MNEKLGSEQRRLILVSIHVYDVHLFINVWLNLLVNPKVSAFEYIFSFQPSPSSCGAYEVYHPIEDSGFKVLFGTIHGTGPFACLTGCLQYMDIFY